MSVFLVWASSEPRAWVPSTFVGGMNSVEGMVNVGVLQGKPSYCDLLLHRIKGYSWLSVDKNY